MVPWTESDEYSQFRLKSTEDFKNRHYATWPHFSIRCEAMLINAGTALPAITLVVLPFLVEDVVFFANCPMVQPKKCDCLPWTRLEVLVSLSPVGHYFPSLVRIKSNPKYSRRTCFPFRKFGVIVHVCKLCSIPQTVRGHAITTRKLFSCEMVCVSKLWVAGSNGSVGSKFWIFLK